jgi:anti-sigma B factor antagonist
MFAADSDRTASPDFHVAVDTEADPPCVAVWGELDLASVAAFRDALNEALAVHPRELVIDLRNATFMGSTGIRELVRIHGEVDRIQLRIATGIVRRALETASLPKRFVIVE